MNIVCICVMRVGTDMLYHFSICPSETWIFGALLILLLHPHILTESMRSAGSSVQPARVASVLLDRGSLTSQSQVLSSSKSAKTASACSFSAAGSRLAYPITSMFEHVSALNDSSIPFTPFYATHARTDAVWSAWAHPGVS